MKQKIERLRSLAQEAYDKVSFWPERNGHEDIVQHQGFMDLIALRNLVPDLLSHIDALEARVAEAREYGAQARIRENDAEQARVSESFRAMKAERALAEAVKERDALRSASTIIRERDEAVEAFRAAEHLCDRLRNIAAGKPVRDLEEAEAAFASARAFIAKMGEK